MNIQDAFQKAVMYAIRQEEKWRRWIEKQCCEKRRFVHIAKSVEAVLSLLSQL